MLSLYVKESVFTGVGRTGWHIDGSFQPAPFAYSLYHMVSIPLKGDTVFAPLSEVIEGLPTSKRKDWERLWMMSDRRSGPVHPLIYTHPITGKKVNF
jgi:alpha-ketoglutarate-dependent taurine dioxygenase